MQQAGTVDAVCLGDERITGLGYAAAVLAGLKSVEHIVLGEARPDAAGSCHRPLGSVQ